MADAAFRADSFAAFDPSVIDETVLLVLNGFFATSWLPLRGSVESPFAAHEKLCVFSVRVSGLTEQQVAVRVPQAACDEIVGLVGLAGQTSCQDVVAELTNTLAGRLKVALADGLSTGIPLPVPAVDLPASPAPAIFATQATPRVSLGVPTYRGVFSCGSLVIEVFTGA